MAPYILDQLHDERPESPPNDPKSRDPEKGKEKRFEKDEHSQGIFGLSLPFPMPDQKELDEKLSISDLEHNLKQHSFPSASTLSGTKEPETASCESLPAEQKEEKVAVDLIHRIVSQKRRTSDLEAATKKRRASSAPGNLENTSHSVLATYKQRYLGESLEENPKNEEPWPKDKDGGIAVLEILMGRLLAIRPNTPFGDSVDDTDFVFIAVDTEKKQPAKEKDGGSSPKHFWNSKGKFNIANKKLKSVSNIASNNTRALGKFISQGGRLKATISELTEKSTQKSNIPQEKNNPVELSDIGFAKMDTRKLASYLNLKERIPECKQEEVFQEHYSITEVLYRLGDRVRPPICSPIAMRFDTKHWDPRKIIFRAMGLLEDGKIAADPKTRRLFVVVGHSIKFDIRHIRDTIGSEAPEVNIIDDKNVLGVIDTYEMAKWLKEYFNLEVLKQINSNTRGEWSPALNQIMKVLGLETSQSKLHEPGYDAVFSLQVALLLFEQYIRASRPNLSEITDLKLRLLKDLAIWNIPFEIRVQMKHWEWKKRMIKFREDHKDDERLYSGKDLGLIYRSRSRGNSGNREKSGYRGKGRKPGIRGPLESGSSSLAQSWTGNSVATGEYWSLQNSSTGTANPTPMGSLSSHLVQPISGNKRHYRTLRGTTSPVLSTSVDSHLVAPTAGYGAQDPGSASEWGAGPGTQSGCASLQQERVEVSLSQARAARGGKDPLQTNGAYTSNQENEQRDGSSYTFGSQNPGTYQGSRGSTRLIPCVGPREGNYATGDSPTKKDQPSTYDSSNFNYQTARNRSGANNTLSTHTTQNPNRPSELTGSTSSKPRNQSQTDHQRSEAGNTSSTYSGQSYNGSSSNGSGANMNPSAYSAQNMNSTLEWRRGDSSNQGPRNYQGSQARYSSNRNSGQNSNYHSGGRGTGSSNAYRGKRNYDHYSPTRRRDPRRD